MLNDMTYTIDVKAFTDSISDRSLEQLCRENPDLRFETDADGKLIIMSRSTYVQIVVRRLAMLTHRAEVKAEKEILVCLPKSGIGTTSVN